MVTHDVTAMTLHEVARRTDTVMMMVTALIPAASVIYVAVFIDDPTTRSIAWFAWAIVTLALVSALFAVWRLEERGAISNTARRTARKALWIGGLVFATAAVLAILWPAAPWRLRLQAGALLCSLLVAWAYLKPLLKE